MTATDHQQAGVLTAAAVREKTFSTTRFRSGYQEDEVDNFLDEIEHSLMILHEENSSLRDQLARGSSATGAVASTQPPAAAPEPASLSPGTSEMEEMLRRTLLLAQRTADQAVAEAREQAQASLAESRTEAQRLLAEARARAQAMELEASTRSTAQLDEADAQRRVVETRVEALRAFEREYRSRLRVYFEMQLQELEAGVAVAAEPMPEPVPLPVIVAEPVWGTPAPQVVPVVEVAPEAQGHTTGADLAVDGPPLARRYLLGDAAQASNLPALAPPALAGSFELLGRNIDPATELAEFAADPNEPYRASDPPEPPVPTP